LDTDDIITPTNLYDMRSLMADLERKYGKFSSIVMPMTLFPHWNINSKKPR